ncbi:hypothetical protein [Lysinibacillus sp. FJAT-14745]|nr:hypothetical protein [Lysinibacillus sp. FJAT-14745]
MELMSIGKFAKRVGVNVVTHCHGLYKIDYPVNGLRKLTID